MAPLEHSRDVERLAELRPIDSLMRALLYIVQQIGRPLSEADVRGLAVLPDERLDEQGFLTVGTRLGLQAGAAGLAAGPPPHLPLPFSVVGGRAPRPFLGARRARGRHGPLLLSGPGPLP